MIVQSGYDLERVQRKLENEVSYVTPIFVDQHLHPCLNELSSLHILFDDNEYVCIPFNHPDGIPLTIDVTNAKKIVTLYKREILHAFPELNQTKVEDAATILHLASETIPEVREYYTPTIQRTLQQFKFKNLHLSVPLVVWMEYAHKLLAYVRDTYKKERPIAYKFISDTVIPTLTTIEQSGMHINPTLIQEHFGEEIRRYHKNHMIHTVYNPYTSTGRPSNKHGGINFAALNKTDGVRKIFDSRFGDDGLLIQLDYEAFHLRLVANQLQYKLPSTSVHTYLAEQYYGTKDITTEQYEKSKQRTFALMYGMQDDDGNVEFFRKVKNYTNDLWEVYEDLGFVVGSYNKRVMVDNPTPNKVFNYTVQWMETAEAMTRISAVCDFLKDSLTKPILYTYDALLLDLHRSETALLPRIRYLMEGDTYPTRMYKGKTYDELISL
jgi:hypothetical protein